MHSRRAAARAYLSHKRHHCKAKRKVIRSKLQRIIGVKNKNYQTKVMRIRVRFLRHSSIRSLYDFVGDEYPFGSKTWCDE